MCDCFILLDLWMHYLDANETLEKDRRPLHKNAASNI